MMDGHAIGVVIPAKNEEEHILRVLETLPPFVDRAVVIDDGSTDSTYDVASNASTAVDVDVIRTQGLGVGGAIDLGHQHFLSTMDQPFISAVMAGDGQMDPSDLHAVIQPIINDVAEHVKGNRMTTIEDIQQMPKRRRRASKILGWLTTLASGRVVKDPQCGFTATSSNLLNEWDWDKSWRGYGYPNFWLIRLSSTGKRVVDVPVKAVYGSEKSGIQPFKFFARVGLMMTLEHHRRAFRHLPHSPWLMFSFVAYLLGYASITLATTHSLYLLGLPIFWWIAHRLDRCAMHQLIGGRTKI